MLQRFCFLKSRHLHVSGISYFKENRTLLLSFTSYWHRSVRCPTSAPILALFFRQLYKDKNVQTMLSVRLFTLFKETCRFSPQNVCFSVVERHCDQTYSISDIEVSLNQVKVMPVSGNIIQDVNNWKQSIRKRVDVLKLLSYSGVIIWPPWKKKEEERSVESN